LATRDARAVTKEYREELLEVVL
jgi:hypothetical protein